MSYRVSDKQAANPFEGTLLHNLLVGLNALQALPTPFVVMALISNSMLAALAWTMQHDLLTSVFAGVSCLLASAIDWYLLRMLPRTGCSFGPDKPPVLALTAVRALLLSAIGLLAAPLWLAVVLMSAISLLAFYTTWIEPFALGVTRQHYTFDGWNADAPPLKVLHIADIHVERITRRERDLNAMIRELKPDVIVFSGDFINISYTDDPKAEADVRAVIGEWSAPLGVFCVPGSSTVETVERVQQFVKGLDNLRLLTNSWITLNAPNGPLNILGMVTTHFIDRDRDTLKRLNMIAPKSGLNLLLTHAPDVAPEADAVGFQLYFAGHTHGGQIRFPIIGALATGSALGRRFVMGRYDLQNTTVYTSRGVGLEGHGAPRARFLCPPEIILWEISGTSRER